jgi:hypothetical protein
MLVIALVHWRVVAVAAEGPLQFNRDIRPILSDNCFRCHGFDKNTREADLRLDTAEAAFAETASGAVPIVPGKPDESEILVRITSEDDDLRMPPPDSHQSLSEAQVATLRQWISEGAQYEPHWAFIPVVRPEVPTVEKLEVRGQKAEVSGGQSPSQISNLKSQILNPIDAFIAHKLAASGLAFSPPADKATLLRRVTFDLTGLPPTPAEVAAFLNDDSPDAYEKAVDRLLASPRYGEHMAADWLDAARYSDTNGYQADLTRTMWPWRDWVIKALNDNMPFDQFTIEQLAGDMLPNPTNAQLVATGFNRNHPMNNEGGRIAEESRNDYVMDRVETTGTVWLGLTVGCCRCHDHKYDPISQAEYYQLFAYFNNIAESGAVDPSGNTPPVVRATNNQAEQHLAGLRQKVIEAEAALSAILPQVESEQAAWEATFNPNATWQLATFHSATTQSGMTIKPQDDGSLKAECTLPATDLHEIIVHTTQPQLTGLRLEAMRDTGLPENGPGWSDSGNFLLTFIEVDARPRGSDAEFTPIELAKATASYSQGGFDIAGALDPSRDNAWAVYQGPPGDHQAAFTFAAPQAFDAGAEVRVRLHYQTSNPEWVEHVIGRLRLSFAAAENPSLSDMPREVVEALGKPAAERNEAQRASIAAYYREQISPLHKQLRQAVDQARSEVAKYESTLPLTMVMQERPDPAPRDTWILKVGIYTNRGDQVQPGVPAALPPLPADQPNNRLTFARWLVSTQNPLTPRVTVNRYWQRFFGTGLVKTSEDFGVQGELPPQRELLDWLAAEFVSSGWNVKAMHRLIVTSAAYRQSSQVTPQLLERDPDNRLLARGPRFRLPAFAIRDAALAHGGLLVEKLGGPPVKPYMAAGVWEDASIGTISYQADKGEGLYRRSIYTFFRRIAAPAQFFDISTRNVCTVRMARTNTPLQALLLMNDVQYVEAARQLALRMLREAGSTPAERINFAFNLCTSRLPTADEQALLLAALQKFQQRFADNPTAAGELIKQGETPLPSDFATEQTPELAAYTMLGSLIFNLDETITKE